MKLYQMIFNLLRAEFPSLTDGGGGFHIYPNQVPDTITPTTAIIYTIGVGVASQNISKIAETQGVQFTAVAQTFQEAFDLADDIKIFFQEKHGTTVNEPAYSKALSPVRTLGQDRESNLWMCNVDILFKMPRLILDA